MCAFKTCLVAMPARTRERKGPNATELPSNNTLRVVMIILVDHYDNDVRGRAELSVWFEVWWRFCGYACDVLVGWVWVQMSNQCCSISPSWISSQREIHAL